MSIVIIFNAPPQSGKDTVVDLIKMIDFQSNMFKSLEHLSFKEPLIELVLRFFDIDRDFWDEHYTSEGKEIKRDWLNGMSQREALIWMSEDCVKPKCGKEFFGEAVAKSIEEDGNTVYLFSDGGFNEELQPIIRKVGAENVFIVRIGRDGYTFEGDSRNYIDVPEIPDENYLYIMNLGDMDDLLDEVYEFIDYLSLRGVFNSKYVVTN